MKRDICNFLLENYDKGTLPEIISNTNTRFLTMKLQATISKKYFLETLVLMEKQKKKNNVFLEEIKALMEFCNRKGLKPVFLKGIFLAADIYPQISQRNFDDIDILIEIPEFLEYDSFLKEKGYSYCDPFREIPRNEEAYSEILKKDHVCYRKKVDSVYVTIELHGNLINDGGLFEDNTVEFLNHTEKKHFLDMDVLLLKAEHNLIFLALHFFKHLPVAYFDKLIFAKHTYINLTNLYDIALLVDKYREILDWKLVLQIAYQMKVGKYVYFVAKKVNDIFGNVFSGEFMDELKLLWDCSYMSESTVEEFGMGKLMWLFHLAVDKICEQEAKDFLNRKAGINLYEFIAVNSSQQKLHEHRNIFKKEFYVNFSKNYANHIKNAITKISIEVAVHKNSFNINYIITNKKCCPYDGKRKPYHYDGIEVLIVKEKYLVHKMFTIVQDANKYKLIQTSHNNDNDEKICPVNLDYRVHVDKTKIQLELSFPWTYVDINPLIDNTVYFNVGGLVSNPFTRQFTDNYQLFDSEKDFFDFRNVKCIRFQQLSE